MSREKTLSVNLFGTRVDLLSKTHVNSMLAEFVDSHKFHHVVTPNTEMVMIKKEDDRLRNITKYAGLSVADGVGIIWAIKLLWKKSAVEKYSGSDMAEFLYKYCNKHNKVIVLLSRNDGLSENSAKLAADNLKSQYSGLNIVPLDVSIASFDGSEIPACDVLLVGFGAPTQDIWINNNKLDLSSIGVVMGAGAVIDFAANIQKRAPKFMQNVGLEWLWRLILQPSRIKRQIKIPIFIFLVLVAKLGLRSKALR